MSGHEEGDCSRQSEQQCERHGSQMIIKLDRATDKTLRGNTGVNDFRPTQHAMCERHYLFIFLISGWNLSALHKRVNVVAISDCRCNLQSLLRSLRSVDATCLPSEFRPYFLRFNYFRYVSPYCYFRLSVVSEITQFRCQVSMHRLTASDFGYDVTLSRWRP